MRSGVVKYLQVTCAWRRRQAGRLTGRQVGRQARRQAGK